MSFSLDSITYKPISHPLTSEFTSKYYLFFKKLCDEIPDQWIEFDQVCDINEYAKLKQAADRWGKPHKPFRIEFTSICVRNADAPEGHQAYGYRINLKVSKREDN